MPNVPLDSTLEHVLFLSSGGANSTTRSRAGNGQVRANLRRQVKRMSRKYGYPPDKADRAAETVIEQAELLEREAA